MNILASRGSFQIRFSIFDVLWAASSPIVALILRDVVDDHGYSLATAAVYCLASFSLSLIAFLIFRIRDGVAHHLLVVVVEVEGAVARADDGERARDAPVHAAPCEHGQVGRPTNMVDLLEDILKGNMGVITLPAEKEVRNAIVQMSRLKFGRPRAEIEAEIQKRFVSEKVVRPM